MLTYRVPVVVKGFAVLKYPQGKGAGDQLVEREAGRGRVAEHLGPVDVGHEPDQVLDAALGQLADDQAQLVLEARRRAGRREVRAAVRCL